MAYHHLELQLQPGKKNLGGNNMTIICFQNYRQKKNYEKNAEFNQAVNSLVEYIQVLKEPTQRLLKSAEINQVIKYEQGEEINKSAV